VLYNCDQLQAELVPMHQGMEIVTLFPAVTLSVLSLHGCQTLCVSEALQA
jgi:hypothetical protein